MGTASHLFRWRRVLALGAASLLLHSVAIERGAAWLRPQAAEAPPAVIVAALHGAPGPAGEQGAVPAAPAPEAGAVVSLPQVQLRGPGRAVKAGPRYRVSLPPSAALTLDVTRSDAGGVVQTGVAAIDWRHAGGAYRLALRTEAGGAVLAEMASEGAVGAEGIVPRSMSAQRRGKAATATHFDARRRRITFSASAASVPMANGAQDRASWPMQLAGIARAGIAQLAGGIALPVGEEKDASVYRFVVVGQEEIETPMGTLATWHLACAPEPGSYRTRLEVWLAPQRHWYPVQLRSTEANGAITTQTVRRIVVNEAGT